MAFGKNKNEDQPKAFAPKKEPYEMRVMPAKFHQYLKVKPKAGASKILLVIALVFFVLTMLGIGGYFLYLQMNLPAPNTNQPNQNSQPVINDNLNLPDENSGLIENLNLAENENLNENINADLNQNENLNISEENGLNPEDDSVINEPSAVSYTGSLDSDSDRLTDLEEEMFQTEKRKADTDEDLFLDGDEIINLYNPKAAGGSKLQVSGLVNTYGNPIFGYSLFYPTGWLARPEDQSLRSVLFITSTEEFMKISVEDNAQKLDLVNWYLSLSPGADLNLLEKSVTKSGYEALISPDKLTYYIAEPDDLTKVYVITYNIGTLKEINFLATFQVMINSFTVKKTESQ